MPVTMDRTREVNREVLVEQLRSLPEESLPVVQRYMNLLHGGDSEIDEFEQWAFSLPHKYGFGNLSEEDIAEIVHQARSEKS